MEMHIRILVFGLLKDIVDVDQWRMQEHATTNDLLETLEDAFPNLANHKYRLAVNEVLIDAPIQLKNNDLIALLPPFSGG